MQVYRAALGRGRCPSVPTAGFNAYSMLHITGVRFAGHNDHELEAALRRGAELRCFSQHSQRMGAPCAVKGGAITIGLPRFGGQSLVCILGFILSYSSPPVVLSVSSPQVSLTRMRQKDDAASARSDFQTPAATDSQRQNVFAGYYTTRPSMRRSLYGLPRAF
jgi:hypothetical protein